MTRLRLASAIPVLGAILLAATPALPQAQQGGAPAPAIATPPGAAPPAAAPAATGAAIPVTIGPALAMHGDVKYGADFRSFEYADPGAPKGGEVRMGVVATTYDNFNPFILRGSAAAYGRQLLFDTLTIGSEDEPFTRYCLVCETMEVPNDRSWIVFNLRSDARFQDGSPITPDDVIFSFNTLREHGHPLYRTYWSQVDRVERSGERGVRFIFKPGDNRELPLIVGELPILSRAYWQGRDFERPTLEQPLSSGPYRIESFEAGRYVVYRRIPNYWAVNHPTRAGQFNFDVVRVDYYRDNTVALEAFKAGQFDMRQENQAAAWANAYNVPAVQQGLIRRDEIPVQRVAGMQGWAMNLRRPQFQDVRVRQALAYAYDFETANRTLFSGAYTRARSYFDNSELAARGLPDAAELRLLEPLRARIPNDVFATEYAPPRTPGTGIEGWRENRRIATQLLRDAGYRVVNQQLVNAQGQQLAFEILLNDPQFERIALPYVENLRALGISARIRTVDTSQYQRRTDDFDYDVTVGLFGQSESPGNEQRDFWSCAARDTPGSSNLIGICDPAIDQLVDQVIAAPDRAGLVAATHALDRMLQWGFYVVPHWYLAADRVAYWDRFGRPARVQRRVGFDPFLWWVDTQRDAALRARRGR